MASTSHLAGALFVACSLSAAAAAEEGSCNDDYVSSQKLRKAGELLEAKEALGRCVADRCAEYQRSDCSTWLDEVERSIPTVVFRVVDVNGKERTDVTVTLEDVVLAEQLDGRPVTVDPGSHTFIMRWPGAEPVTRTVTIVVGEKNRQLVVDLEAPAPAPVREETPVASGFHPAAWVLGAAGLAGFGVFAGVGAFSVSLEDCAPTCSDDRVDEIELTRIVADVGLTVGATTLAAALIVAIATWESGDGDVALVTSGTDLGLRGRF